MNDSISAFTLAGGYNMKMKPVSSPCPSIPVTFLSNVDLETQSGTPISVPIYLVLIPTAIIVARPLKELVSHIKNWKMPSFELIARVIKTLVLSVFRWHLCDKLISRDGNSEDNTLFTYTYKKRFVVHEKYQLEIAYPYLLQNAYVLEFKDPPRFSLRTQLGQYPVLNPDAFVRFYKNANRVDLTQKALNNTIYDLFQSQYLKLQTS